MSCLGVTFAIDEKTKDTLLSMKRSEIVDYIKDEIEETFFAEKIEYKAEYDKSWDATHRAFSNENFCLMLSRYKLKFFHFEKYNVYNFHIIASKCKHK